MNAVNRNIVAELVAHAMAPSAEEARRMLKEGEILVWQGRQFIANPGEVISEPATFVRGSQTLYLNTKLAPMAIKLAEKKPT